MEDIAQDFTDVAWSWKNPFSLQNEDIGLKVGLVVFNIATVLLGAILYFAFYSYERYGGDPQKRGLINQVITENCLGFL